MFVQSVVRARSEIEAAWLVYEGKPGTRLIAGGTDLMLQMDRGHCQASNLVDLRHSDMDGIRFDKKYLRIGATATISDIVEFTGLKQGFADLQKAAATLASRQIRNMATLGGNVANASPAADLVPSLMVRDTLLRVRCGDDFEDMPISDFFTGPGKHRLSQKQMISEILIPHDKGTKSRVYVRFLKQGFRGAQIIAVVNMALRLLVDKNGKLRKVACALGSVGPTARRANNVEALLVNKSLTPVLIREAAEAVQDDISPIDDLRASAAYRRRVAGNFVRLALEEIRAESMLKQEAQS